MNMRTFYKKNKDKIIGFIISIAVFVSVITLYNLETRDIFKLLRFFKANELESLDTRFRIRGKRDPGDEIAIVIIDENSILKLGRYPWPRGHIAKFVDTISSSGAKVLVFDVIYSEPQNQLHLKSLNILEKSYFGLNKDRLLDQDDFIEAIEKEKSAANDDQKLQNSFQRAVMEQGVNIVIGFRFVDEYEAKTTGFPGRTLSQKSQLLLKESAYFPVYVHIPDFLKGKNSDQENIIPEVIKQKRKMIMEMYPPKKAIGTLNAIYPFAMWATYQGFTDQNVDYIGKTRNDYVAIKYKDDFYPSLGVQAARTFLDVDQGNLQFWLANKLVINDLEIPLDDVNRMLIDYCGPAYTFKTYSFIDVFEGRIGPEAFKDKIVLIGATPSLGDFVQTPFSSMMPGVEKQATVIENIIHGKFLRRGKREAVTDLIAIIVLSLLLGIILPLVPILIGGGISAALLFGYYYYCYHCFVDFGLWFNVTYPTIAVILCFSFVSLYHYFSTEKARRMVKGAFENFLDPNVVKEVLREPETIKLGGEERDVTVFFSDIAKFSTISEPLTPTQLVEFLNMYLSEMTEIVLEHGGYLDKYIGDAIVAAFGTPLHQPDHAIKACFAAIDSQKKLIEMSNEFSMLGLGEVRARIGINTGAVLAGNVGSQNRLSYTVIGDNVNLGARLEAANKEFGTYNMISEMTYEQAKDYIEVRELDIIRVVGKKIPVKVYELIDRKNSISPEKKEVIELFEKGIVKYREQMWDDAIKYFNKVLSLDKEDKPAELYFKRCLEYKKTPPPADWDRVFTMLTK